jgi:aerobic-type carbon monoxide dehydrogenase small subunit (CoxS/CutS family)
LPSTAGSNVVRFDGTCIPAGAITAYQTSGSSINTIVVIQG